MPRKYDKKTKANFRAGRRNSRRVSMRINMVSPGFSMFNDEYDPAIDDTMLMLKAKGIDRERERFAEALSEVRDRITRVSRVYTLCYTRYTFLGIVKQRDNLKNNPSYFPKFL